jgi:NitT/TauT family transport system ATP-binding protein
MIEMKNVTFSYDEKNVLKDFSLAVNKGETVCLFGSSGCGKTTVLHLLSGILKPQSGTVKTVPAAVVFQEDRLLPWMTVLQNVAVVLDETPEIAETQAEKWLETVGLLEEKDAFPADLSGGMKRRVAIARALAKGGDSLLLDEPFTGLDSQNRARCIALIQKRFENAAVVLITHVEEEAKLMNAKIIYM